MRLLDVGEIGVEQPREFEWKRCLRAIADDDARGEVIEANPVSERDIHAALRNAFAVTRLDVARLAAAAAL